MLLPAITLLVVTLIPAPADEIVYKELNKLGPAILAFDWTGVDRNGEPVETKHAEFIWRVSPPPTPAPPPIVVKTSGPPVVGEGTVNRYLVRLLAANVPVGKYRVTVRVIAAEADRPPGVESSSLFFDLVEKKVPPDAPTNFRDEE